MNHEARVAKYSGDAGELVKSYSAGFSFFETDSYANYLLMDQEGGENVSLLIVKTDKLSHDYNLIILTVGRNQETLRKKMKDFILKTEIETAQAPPEVEEAMEILRKHYESR